MPSVSMGSYGILIYGVEHKKGDPPPTGYLDWHEWADVQHKAGLRQVQCGVCGLWRFPQELSVKVKCSSPVCLACDEAADAVRRMENVQA